MTSLRTSAWEAKCCHDINKLNFNRNTKFSNLSLEKRAALENLSKRKHIIVEAADKGGALVVWQAALYQKSNFRTPLFMLKSIKISPLITNKLLRESIALNHRPQRVWQTKEFIVTQSMKRN